MHGHKGLHFEEPLLYELHQEGKCGVDWSEMSLDTPALGSLLRKKPIGLPCVSEPEVVRHFTRLSQKNFGIDSGMYPLGSCTMKHNPRLNEKVARFEGFAHLHPMAPMALVSGAHRVMSELSKWLLELTGMKAVALSPAAGAQGEFCGILAIRKALEARGERRHIMLVPESAHGTNPATAALCGFEVVTIPAEASGHVSLGAVKAHLGPDVAGIMLTNPNTCGLFETEIVEIAKAVHEAGGYFYCDGANFNALMGRVRPADLGIDCMHINLHKTFSTPHGGGGPGSGPVVFSDALAPFVPYPYVVDQADGSFEFVERPDGKTMGRMKAFHGQMGMFVRALTYMLSHGKDGLRQASSDAVLSANYIFASLKDVYHAPFKGPFMHECLFTDKVQKEQGSSTLDIAKGLLDRGFHPMTIYFPLVVSGAMLIEPTDTESKKTLDDFIAVMRDLGGKGAELKEAPHHTPRRRLDETKAARDPRLVWRP